MKHFLATILCIFLFAALSPLALAVNSRDVSFETPLSERLEELGLFRGVGKNAAGATDFALDQKLNRAEAVVMLIRALGKGVEAEAYPKTHPFKDVPAWADCFVSYAYDKKLANGLSSTRFGSEQPVSAAMYLTFMLRSLGYSEGDAGDFTWDAPWSLAGWCGILPMQVDKIDFLRADAVDLTCAALYASPKGTNTTLQKQLVSQGIFTEEQFKAAFPQDPFADFRLLDRKVSDAIATKETLGLHNNVYTSEFHIIVDTKEDNGVLIVTAMVFTGSADIKNDNTIGSNGGGMGPCIIKFDAKTLQYQSCQTAKELGDLGLSWNDCLPTKALVIHDSLTKGTCNVLKMETQMKLDSKTIAYQQPSYEQALANVTSYLSRIPQRIETTPCTIVFGWLDGTPHGSYAELYLVYKANSAVGEGNVVSLPMPIESFWARTSAPNDLHLSNDGLTLFYSYHYKDRLAIREGDPPSEHVYHEAGTYSYTVDLNTGTTSLKILPN